MGSAVQSLRRPWEKKALVLAAGVIIAVAVLLLWGPRAGFWAAIDAVILRLRDAGPVPFFIAMAVLPAVGFPLLAFTLAAGPVFGPTLGAGWVVAWSLVAVSANLLLTYWLALRALQPLVRRALKYFGIALPETGSGSGWQLALIVRLTPGPPFWLQSYVLALVRVPLVPYLVVSILVMAGYIVALVCGGAAIAQGNGRLAVIAGGALVASVILLLWWRKRVACRGEADMRCAPATETFRVAWGAADADSLATGLPVIAGDGVEALFGVATPAGQSGRVTLYTAGDWLLGAATLPLTDGLDAVTRRVYGDLLAATRGRYLARIWNYIPAINEPGPDGLENYRIFCRARSVAFEEHFGRDFKALLPSASAVGTKSDALTVVFAACPVPPDHVENPQQVPAYDYPREHGPRPPAFARATRVAEGAATHVFISGTAAIRGHETVAPNDLAAQLTCTIENLRIISAACGLGSDLDRAGSSTRTFKVYLRHPVDQPLAAAVLTKELLRSTDRVSYLHADICRAALAVEIEVALFGVTRAS
jgi:chorismate lyase/3-hydroxybenzoate synthase